MNDVKIQLYKDRQTYARSAMNHLQNFIETDDPKFITYVLEDLIAILDTYLDKNFDQE